MLKKYCVVILCFFIVIGILFLSQFTSLTSTKGQKVVYGTVLEVYDIYLLVELEEGEEVRKRGSIARFDFRGKVW